MLHKILSFLWAPATALVMAFVYTVMLDTGWSPQHATGTAVLVGFGMAAAALAIAFFVDDPSDQLLDPGWSAMCSGVFAAGSVGLADLWPSMPLVSIIAAAVPTIACFIFMWAGLDELFEQFDEDEQAGEKIRFLLMPIGVVAAYCLLPIIGRSQAGILLLAFLGIQLVWSVLARGRRYADVAAKPS